MLQFVYMQNSENAFSSAVYAEKFNLRRKLRNMLERNAAVRKEQVTFCEETTLKALLSAGAEVDNLQEKGKEKVEVNQFGDKALVGDVRAERSVIDVLQDSLTEANKSAMLVSEEHASIGLGEKPEQADFLFVLDGIDGTNRYVEDEESGTILGVFAGSDPKYQDYVAGGLREHKNKIVYLGSRNKGAWRINEAERTPLHTSSKTSLDENCLVYADLLYDEYYKKDVVTSKVKNLPCPVECLKASAIHYARLAEGKAEAVVECTRKNTLEIAGLFALVAEAGGVMVDINGQVIDYQKFLEHGETTDEVVISACNLEMAQQVAEKLRAKKEVTLPSPVLETHQQ